MLEFQEDESLYSTSTCEEKYHLSSFIQEIFVFDKEGHLPLT